jgi:threonine dehydratase
MWPSAPSWARARGDHRRDHPRAPGSFKAFCEAIGKRQITEFNYRYTPAARRTSSSACRPTRKTTRAARWCQLTEQGFPVLDLTDNELAKLHIRHMVGGHAAGQRRSGVALRVPGAAGALFNFLNKLGGRWNISMFHYRNHGAADGRVVAGLQVPEDERHLVPAALAKSATRTGTKVTTRPTSCSSAERLR